MVKTGAGWFRHIFLPNEKHYSFTKKKKSKSSRPRICHSTTAPCPPADSASCRTAPCKTGREAPEPQHHRSMPAGFWGSHRSRADLSRDRWIQGQSANRYTTGPSNSNSVLQTSWRQKDVKSRWWNQGRDDLGTFSCQMKTLFFY